MQTNQTPFYDGSVNTTGCCARFNPAGWDGQRLHFEDKRFVLATTRSLLHVPLNMGSVFTRVQGHVAAAGAEVFFLDDESLGVEFQRFVLDAHDVVRAADVAVALGHI